MAFHLQLTLLVLCAFVRVKSDACVYAVCLCMESEIRCPYRDLTALPPLTGSLPGLWRLILDNNDITEIPSGSLPPNLMAISMMNNPITTIAIDAFDGSIHTLNEMAFSKAGFTRIPDAFGRLNALELLTIYDTNIQDWNEKAMKNIGPNMLSVTLENVGLTTWPTWIGHFSNLTELSISGSSISSLPNDALDMLAETLTSLSLTSSKLISMPMTLSNLKNLEYLNLDNNQISNVTWIPRSSRLVGLSLSSNSISQAKHLSDCLRILEHSLKDLTLTQNHLSSIPDLSYLTKVGNFDFSRNRISDPISGSLPATLYSLDFRYNNLQSIPTVYFSLQIIKDLMLTSNFITEIRASQIPSWTLEANLDYNLITELSDTSFPENCSLTSLNLMNNPLTKISNFAFKDLPHLTMLNLQGTRLTRIPQSLTYLVSLTYLNVANNLGLICTCLEKKVESVILKPACTIIGDCGLTSVYEFYNQLGQDCP